MIYFIGVGREKGRDPYFRHLYRVGFDGKNLTLLTPDDGDHDVVALAVRPLLRRHLLAARRSRRRACCATPTAGEVARAREGRHLEAAGRRLEAADPVHGEGARRRDRPLRPDVPADRTSTRRRSTRSSTTSIPGRRPAASAAAASRAARGDTQALAELGFIVVEIDGMGTPWRSKKFHDAYYGDMGDNTLPDQVAGMKQLAQRYPWIDIDRAGIYGALGRRLRDGRRACSATRTSSRSASRSRATTTTASYEDDWGEKWQGLLEEERRRHDELRRPGQPEPSRRT